MTKSILDGFENCVNDFFKFHQRREGLRYSHRESCLDLDEGHLSCLKKGGISLFESLYKIVESNWNKESPTSWRNWRLTKELYIKDTNRSGEKNLEKEIAEKNKNWFNQSPAASGLADSKRDRKMAVDLVHKKGRKTFEFIELKINSNTPLYAAIEILLYGLLYLFYRAQSMRCNGWVNPNNKELLGAREVELKVLAPGQYYVAYSRDVLLYLEEILSKLIGKFARSKIRGLTMNFSFEEFQNSVDLPAKRRRLTAVS